jgi:hypothetical protein
MWDLKNAGEISRFPQGLKAKPAASAAAERPEMPIALQLMASRRQEMAEEQRGEELKLVLDWPRRTRAGAR